VNGLTIIRVELRKKDFDLCAMKCLSFINEQYLKKEDHQLLYEECKKELYKEVEPIKEEWNSIPQNV